MFVMTVKTTPKPVRIVMIEKLNHVYCCFMSDGSAVTWNTLTGEVRTALEPNSDHDARVA